jgi:hypothetical protein
MSFQQKCRDETKGSEILIQLKIAGIIPSKLRANPIKFSTT